MKSQFNALPYHQMRASLLPSFMKKTMKVTATSYYLVMALGVLLFTGCTKQELKSSKNETLTMSNKESNGNVVPPLKYEGLEKQTLWELQQVRAATAKYRQVKNAVKDGYVDINVYVPGQGYHYMNMSLVDATFDVRNPEILVYQQNPDGSLELVAVEYAVPTSMSPSAPAGFTGSNDVWERNDEIDMWFLHAWVWSYNPSGVFYHMNPLFL